MDGEESRQGRRCAGADAFPPSGPRQRLRAHVLPEVRQLAVPDGSGKDEMVLGASLETFRYAAATSVRVATNEDGVHVGPATGPRRG